MYMCVYVCVCIFNMYMQTYMCVYVYIALLYKIYICRRTTVVTFGRSYDLIHEA